MSLAEAKAQEYVLDLLSDKIDIASANAEVIMQDFVGGFNEGLRQAVEIVKSYLEEDGINYFGQLQTVWEAIEDEVSL